MRAYSDVYLGDVVENQGKLFDYVANTYPDKDTEDFINAYMTSKTRQSIQNLHLFMLMKRWMQKNYGNILKKPNIILYNKEKQWKVLCQIGLGNSMHIINGITIYQVRK